MFYRVISLGIYFYNRSNNSNKNNNPSRVNSNSNNNNNSNTSANKNNNLSQVKNNTSANNNNNIIKVLVVCSSDKDTATDFNIQQESISEVTKTMFHQQIILILKLTLNL